MDKIRITAEELRQNIQKVSHYVWERQEAHRSHCNWMYAIEQLVKEKNGVFPSSEEINRRAYQLWLERKDEQAHQDWCQAEALQRQYFEIVN